jgi:hypothetical protein
MLRAVYSHVFLYNSNCNYRWGNIGTPELHALSHPCCWPDRSGRVWLWLSDFTRVVCIQQYSSDDLLAMQPVVVWCSRPMHFAFLRGLGYMSKFTTLVAFMLNPPFTLDSKSYLGKLCVEMRNCVCTSKSSSLSDWTMVRRSYSVYLSNP